MRVARAIVNDRFLLNAFLGDGDCEVDHTFRIGRRGHHANLKCVQTFPRVAVAQFCQVPARVLIDLNLVIAEPALFVSQRAVDQLVELLDA